MVNSVVTRGFGPGASIALVVMAGYSFPEVVVMTGTSEVFRVPADTRTLVAPPSDRTYRVAAEERSDN